MAFHTCRHSEAVERTMNGPKGFRDAREVLHRRGAPNNGYLNIFIRVCNQPIEGLDGFVRFCLSRRRVTFERSTRENNSSSS